MNTTNQTTPRARFRWLRVALLTYTMAGPVVNALLERMRKRSQETRESAQAHQENAQARQAELRERLNELSQESRRRVAEQVQHLRKQTRQLQKQSQQLAKALRKESKQRRKLAKQLRKSGLDWSQDVLKRGELLTEALLAQGEKATRELAERSAKMTQELAKRGRKATQSVAQRGEDLLKPGRKPQRNFWALVGFGVGMLVAGAITYWFVRRQMAGQELEEDQPIELPAVDAWNGMQSQGRPAGQIRQLDQDETAVVTLEVVEVASSERPEDAVFAGVVSTQYYYPVDIAPRSEDLVYFTSEEEARARGFKAAGEASG